MSDFNMSCSLRVGTMFYSCLLLPKLSCKSFLFVTLCAHPLDAAWKNEWKTRSLPIFHLSVRLHPSVHLPKSRHTVLQTGLRVLCSYWQATWYCCLHLSFLSTLCHSRTSQGSAVKMHWILSCPDPECRPCDQQLEIRRFNDIDLRYVLSFRQSRKPLPWNQMYADLVPLKVSLCFLFVEIGLSLCPLELLEKIHTSLHIENIVFPTQSVGFLQ